MITVGNVRRDESRPYPSIAAASFDVLGFRHWKNAAWAAERLCYRFGVGFETVEVNGRFYAVEVIARPSKAYREMAHRVRGSSRWAIVRRGAPDVKFDRQYTESGDSQGGQHD
jgi:hypothetical protein